MNIVSVALVIVAASADQPRTAEPIRAAQVRASAVRALDYLDTAGVAWIKERKCVTCHHVPFLIWTSNEARQRGLTVDEAKLTEWTRWSVDYVIAQKGHGTDTMTNMILARDRSAAAEPEAAGYAKLVEMLVQTQKPDGSWEAGGQLPTLRRSAREAVETTTMWTVLALASLDAPSEAVLASRDKALAYLKNGQPGQTTEWLAVRLLVESRYGGTANRSEDFLKDLLQRQNADGGWGWIKDEASDALATGQALYALGVLGRSGNDPAVQRAWRFLVGTQQTDGSWYVVTKKAKGKTSDISTYWGSAWGVLGLLRTLPQ